MTAVKISRANEPVEMFFVDLERGQFFWFKDRLYCRPKAALKSEAFLVEEATMVTFNPAAVCIPVNNVKVEAS